MKTWCWVVMSACLAVASVDAHAAPLVQPVESAAAGAEKPGVTLVKKRTESRSSSSSKPLTGQTAWIVSGLVGALVPLAFFALPLIWFAWIPGGAFVIVFACIWAGIMGLGGGLVAWLMMTFLSPERSGILLPVLVSGAVTAAIALVAGIIAVCILVAGYITASFLGAWYLPGPRPPWSGGRSSGLGAGAWWGFSLLAFAVWTTGAITASLAGPLVGAYLFHRLSIPSDGRTHLDILTP